MGKNIKLYSTSTCPYRAMVKKYFKDKNVIFENIDVSRNQEWIQEMADKSGQMGVPVLDIEGKIIVGFDEKAINEALGL